jgi:phosphopantothenoylcysteine decarboxylase / phosphopantothenate---cysteine ligase
LPADLAIFCAAVADWRVKTEAKAKIKKQKGAPPPSLALEPNPDILATIAGLKKGRPSVVVGFAAETHDVLTYAKGKLASKTCDVIVANDVGAGKDVMGGDNNSIHLVSKQGVETWPTLPKTEVAARLIAHFSTILPKKSTK